MRPVDGELSLHLPNTIRNQTYASIASLIFRIVAWSFQNPISLNEPKVSDAFSPVADIEPLLDQQSVIGH